MPSEDTVGRLRDIVDNIDRIIEYTDGLSQSEYEKSRITIDAVERCLQRVTEASIKAQPHAAEILPLHDWKAMRNFGNVLRHGYNTIVTEVVWQIIRDDLPALRHDCIQAIAELDENGQT